MEDLSGTARQPGDVLRRQEAGSEGESEPDGRDLFPGGDGLEKLYYRLRKWGTNDGRASK